MTTRPLTAEETRIIEIARQAVFDQGNWLADSEFDMPERDGTGWRIYVRRLPPTPGGHAVIVIDKNGKVTEYHGGA